MRNLIASSALAAALLALPSTAFAQNGPFCIQGGETGALNCSFNTMAQCREAASDDQTATCIPNPQLRGTVGEGIGEGTPASPEPRPSPDLPRSPRDR